MRRLPAYLVLACSATLALASCGGGGGASDDASAAPSDEATESPPPQVKVAYRGQDEYQEIAILSNEDKPITIKTITLNDLSTDQDCHLKVFKVLKNGESITVPAAKCGNILKLVVETDRGNIENSYDPKEGGLKWLISENSIEITNTSTGEMKIDRMVLNGREGDSSCDIKIFKVIASNDYIDVKNTGGCGQIKNIKIYYNYNGKDQVSDNPIVP